MVIINMVLRFFFTLFFPTLCMAAVYNPGYYGEKDFDHYLATRPLFFRADPFLGNIIFEEDAIHKNYINMLVSPPLIAYEEFINNDLKNSLLCPNSIMSEMYSYLRFSNRVIALSYIYESIKLQGKTFAKLGLPNSCNIDWQDVLKNCETKTKDMDIFVKSAKHIIQEQKEYTVDMNHSIKTYKRDWDRQFKSNAFKDITHYRVDQYCKNHKCIPNLNYKSAMSVISKTCQLDKNLFINICSEKDNIFGMSEIQEAYPLLAESDIFSYYSSLGNVNGCLRRFTKQNQSKEVVDDRLKLIFPIVYQALREDKNKSIQGDIFVAGNLKQFVEKGLEGIYREEKKHVEKVVVSKAVQTKEFSPKEDKVEFIEKVIKKEIQQKKKKISKKKKKKKKVRKSTYLVAVELQQQMDMDLVRVDMLKFRYDFLFSIELKKMLDQNLKSYTTRKGLSQMKKFDNLGTIDGPLPLIFLKYLIETNKHQSLYNILSIIGDKFYVNNDIDRIANTKYDYIELKNDETTGNQWQINILRVPQNPKD